MSSLTQQFSTSVMARWCVMNGLQVYHFTFPFLCNSQCLETIIYPVTWLSGVIIPGKISDGQANCKKKQQQKKTTMAEKALRGGTWNGYFKSLELYFIVPLVYQ